MSDYRAVALSSRRTIDTHPLPTMFRYNGCNPQYTKDCKKTGIQALGISSTMNVWLNCTSYIKISTPRSDVCVLPEKHRNAIREAITDVEKLEATD